MEREFRALEEHAFAAWPAQEVVDLGGWRLRHTRGLTRRANSVFPGALATGDALDRRIAAVERFYRKRGQPALFQIGPLAQPPGLDDALARRGYAREAPVAVQVAGVLDPQPRASAGVRVWDQPTPEWLNIAARRGRFCAAVETYLGLLRRLAGRGLFAVAGHRGAPAAVGLAVLDGEWAGLFSMLTLPAHRRRGLASAVVAALAGAARVRGAQRLYLQVERGNSAALALYARCGFQEAYGYHYRRGSDL